jgi:hypothetical protein
MVNLLSFTKVYFFESGHFNGLRPIQVKNSLPYHLVLKSHNRTLSPAAATAQGGSIRRMKRYSTNSDYRKDMVMFSAHPLAPQVSPGVFEAVRLSGNIIA